MKKQCEICGSRRNLEKHHISYEQQIIITTCAICNNQIKVRKLEGKPLKELITNYKIKQYKVLNDL